MMSAELRLRAVKNHLGRGDRSGGQTPMLQDRTVRSVRDQRLGSCSDRLSQGQAIRRLGGRDAVGEDVDRLSRQLEEALGQRHDVPGHLAVDEARYGLPGLDRRVGLGLGGERQDSNLFTTGALNGLGVNLFSRTVLDRDFLTTKTRQTLEHELRGAEHVDTLTRLKIVDEVDLLLALLLVGE